MAVHDQLRTFKGPNYHMLARNLYIARSVHKMLDKNKMKSICSKLSNQVCKLSSDFDVSLFGPKSRLGVKQIDVPGYKDVKKKYGQHI